MHRTARYGLWLFLAYVVLYAGFIFLAVFNTEALGEPALFGINLGIVYGVGLIKAAIVFALVYMILCSRFGADDT